MGSYDQIALLVGYQKKWYSSVSGRDTDADKEEPSDDVVERCTGGWGQWHRSICLSIFLVKFPVAWHQLVHIFLAPPTPFNCELNDTQACSTECPSLKFDTSVFEKTVISEWSLVCEKAWLADLAQTMVMVGILVGNVLFGYLADRFGRRSPLIAAVLLQVVTGSAAAFAPWYPLFVTLRFLSALATGGTMITSFVLVMELVGQSHRTALGLLYQVPFNLGHLTLVGLAYWLRDWHYLQLAVSLPSLVLLGYQLVLPESPRWLLAVGRGEQCIQVMEKIARHNGLPTDHIRAEVDKELLTKKTEEESRGGNFLDLVRTRTMAVRTVCISFNWAVCGLCFFGVAQYMGQIPGDVFVNVAISAVVGMPGMLILLYSLQAWGRRNTLIVSNVITGVSCLLIPAVPSGPGWVWAGTTLGCIGIFGMSMAFPTVYMYSGEMYPTRVRNLGVGFCSMICRVGSMLAPHVTRLGVLRPELPPLIFGLAPIIGALLCAFLPETSDCKLPDSVHEADQIGNKQKEPTNT